MFLTPIIWFNRSDRRFFYADRMSKMKGGERLYPVSISRYRVMSACGAGSARTQFSRCRHGPDRGPGLSPLDYLR